MDIGVGKGRKKRVRLSVAGRDSANSRRPPGASDRVSSRRHAAVDATRRADDEISLQNNPTRSRTGLAGYSFKKQLGAETAKRLSRLIYDGEKGGEDSQMFDVVEAYETDILGNRETALAQSLHSADGGHVVNRKKRCRNRIVREDFLRRAIPADPVDGGPDD